MTYVTCRLTAKNRDQLRNPTLGNRVWATFLVRTFFVSELNNEYFTRQIFKTVLSGLVLHASLLHLLLEHGALADLGFLEGVTVETGASEASEHWDVLGLRENEIWCSGVAMIWLEEGHKTTSK